MQGLGINGHWIGIHDADPRASAIYARHYSNVRGEGRRKTRGFVGPGEKMVLLTVDCSALFVWHPALTVEEIATHQLGTYRSGNGTQTGVMCSVFRNEGKVKSSDLILEAEELAWHRWPHQRLYTYVWDAKVKSVNPGYCFKKAGWKTCGRNKDGRLTILEKLPAED